MLRALSICIVCAQLAACSGAPQMAENQPQTDATPAVVTEQATVFPTPVFVEHITLAAEEAGTTQNANPPDEDEAAPPAGGLPAPLATPSDTQTQIRPVFDRFVDQVKNGNAEQVVGVYIDNILSLRVVQQPPDDPNYVSNIKGVATQFSLAYTVAGNIGLLAHNYLSGALFFNIKQGDLAQLVYGDGRVDDYEVTDYREYQALTPNSPTSEFIDLTSGEQLSANDLFSRIYTGEHRLVFQTCINQDNVDTWGRLFVLSFPY